MLCSTQGMCSNSNKCMHHIAFSFKEHIIVVAWIRLRHFCKDFFGCWWNSVSSGKTQPINERCNIFYWFLALIISSAKLDIEPPCWECIEKRNVVMVVKLKLGLHLKIFTYCYSFHTFILIFLVQVAKLLLTLMFPLWTPTANWQFEFWNLSHNR